MSGKSIVIKVIIGVVIVALMVGCIFLLLPEEKAEITEEITVYSNDIDSVFKVEVFGSENYALTKTENGWKMDGIDAIKVNKPFADTLLKSMCDISSPMLIEEGADLSVYGLDKPESKVILHTENGKSQINIGLSSGDYRYMNIDGNNMVYIVHKDDLYMVELEKMKYLDEKVFDFAKEKVNKLSLANVRFEKSDDVWHETYPFEYVADETKVEKIIDAMLSTECVDIVRGDFLLARSDAIFMSVAEGERKVEFSVYRDGESAYIMHNIGEYAYKVNYSEGWMNPNAFDCVYKYIAPVAISDVTRVRLVSDKGEDVLYIEAPSSDAPVFYKNGKEVTEKSFKEFYQNMMALTFTGEGTGKGEAEYEIIFTLETGEEYEVGFVNKSESEYCVDVNGKRDFMINKKTVTDLFKKIAQIEEA